MQQPINARAGKYVSVQKHKIGANYTALSFFPGELLREAFSFSVTFLTKRGHGGRQATKAQECISLAPFMLLRLNLCALIKMQMNERRNRERLVEWSERENLAHE